MISCSRSKGCASISDTLARYFGGELVDWTCFKLVCISFPRSVGLRSHFARVSIVWSDGMGQAFWVGPNLHWGVVPLQSQGNGPGEVVVRECSANPSTGDGRNLSLGPGAFPRGGDGVEISSSPSRVKTLRGDTVASSRCNLASKSRSICSNSIFCLSSKF